MDSSQLTTYTIYCTISLAAFITSRALANLASGSRPISLLVLASVIFSFFCGAAHMSIVKLGKPLFFADHFDSFTGDGLLKWIALIAALLQCKCFPCNRKPTHWFFRKTRKGANFS